MIAAADPAPLSEMNTTPLIDVLLVLLIMFIITIPIQSHAVKIDLPGAPITAKVDRVKNKVVITEAGTVLWNGSAVGMGELEALLNATRRMDPAPELQVEPAALARYEVVDQVLAATKRAQVTRMGFVGNERYASF
jgi:biopolymer transport protein ExbD